MPHRSTTRLVEVTQTQPPTESSQNSYEDEHATAAVYGESFSTTDDDEDNHDLDVITNLRRHIHIDDLPILNPPVPNELTSTR